MPHESIHRAIRALTRRAPYLEVAIPGIGRRVLLDDLNILLGKWFFDADEPVWLVSDAVGTVPALELDVSTRLQRKLFYFPKAWGRHWLDGPLGRYMNATLRPGDTFFDIGANLGIYSLHGARLVGTSGKIVAFEPEVRIFESLRRSALRNGFANVECVPWALSDENSEVKFFTSWHGGANSLVAEEGRYRGEMIVRARRLDDCIGELDVDPRTIKLMKIDVEGAEVRTVAGMLAALDAAGCPALWIEVRGPQGSTRAPDTYARVHELLAPLGYVPHRWRDGATVALGPHDRVEFREDILFLHPARGRPE